MKLLRQYLYLFNFFLLLEFLLTFFLVSLIKNSAVIKKINPTNKDEVAAFSIPEQKKPPISQIYGRRDIFGLDQNSGVIEQATSPQTTALPQLVIPEIAAAPASPKVDFIDPLPITVNGIIGSSVEDRTICIIADETDQEETYKVGDRIKDGSIIKILRDRVVVLRLNGQLETFFLHEINSPTPTIDATSSLEKIADFKYRIDPTKFKKSIVNLGGMLDVFDVVPFSDKNSQMIGVVVIDKDPKGLPAAMGFEENDLILSIDNINLTSNKNRMAIYDLISEKEENSEISVEFERNGNKMKTTYLLQTTTPKVGNIPEGIFAVDPNRTNKSSNEPSEFVGLVNAGKSKSIFPEQTNPEERKKSDELYKKNIKRIREDMLARVRKRAS